MSFVDRTHRSSSSPQAPNASIIRISASEGEAQMITRTAGPAIRLRARRR
jgi:hypothetical protein